MKRQTLTCVLIDDRQYTDPPTVGKSLSNEIHAPALIRSRCRPLSDALPLSPFLAPLGSHD